MWNVTKNKKVKSLPPPIFFLFTSFKRRNLLARAPNSLRSHSLTLACIIHCFGTQPLLLPLSALRESDESEYNEFYGGARLLLLLFRATVYIYTRQAGRQREEKKLGVGRGGGGKSNPRITFLYVAKRRFSTVFLLKLELELEHGGVGEIP